MAASKRAVQFTPFAALRGFEILLADRERVRVEKIELMEDMAEILSRKMAAVKKGQRLRVVYYDDGEYICATGLVSSVDFEKRTLTIVKTEIDFDLICDISTL